MRRPFPCSYAVLAAATVLWASTAFGDAIPLDVETAVSRAIEVNPLVRAAGHETDRSAETLRRARAQRILPETKVKVSTGLVPEARGTIFTSPDDYDDLDGMAPFYRAELKFVQPIFTFGKLSALVDGASRGLAVNEAREEHTTQSVALETIRAYWGLSTAARGERTALDLKADYDRLLAEVEERVEDESSEVDDVDLLEVRSKGYLIDKGVLDADAAKSVAVEALRALLAYDQQSAFSTADERTPVSAIGDDGLPCRR